MPSGDPESLARTVSQALQSSQVKEVANIVSSSGSQEIIQATVALLPAESVLPLLAVIQSQFENGKSIRPLSPLSSTDLPMFRLWGGTESGPVAEGSADWSRPLPDVSPRLSPRPLLPPHLTGSQDQTLRHHPAVGWQAGDVGQADQGEEQKRDGRCQTGEISVVLPGR